MSANKNRVKSVITLIEEIVRDTSVTPRQTFDILKEVVSELEARMDSLEEAARELEAQTDTLEEQLKESGNA